jgi:ketosteroid isomerase-like protein
MTTAHEKNRALAQALDISVLDAQKLRRAQLTLRRWAELECGDSNDYQSWCIVRDDDGSTWHESYPHNGKMRRSPARDLERGALKRVAKLCTETGLHYYHQGDPRGCALYVSREPLTDTTYNRGTACL